MGHTNFWWELVKWDGTATYVSNHLLGNLSKERLQKSAENDRGRAQRRLVARQNGSILQGILCVCVNIIGNGSYLVERGFQIGQGILHRFRPLLLDGDFDGLFCEFNSCTDCALPVRSRSESLLEFFVLFVVSGEKRIDGIADVGCLWRADGFRPSGNVIVNKSGAVYGTFNEGGRGPTRVPYGNWRTRATLLA
jgi:hypothetical protein